jgi:cytochrome b involved in lipid metabolism
MVVDECNNEVKVAKKEEELTETKALEPVRIKIKGKWLLLSEEFVANHPGGSVIYQYRWDFKNWFKILC